jgi:two-component system response regulator FixJ
VKHRSTDLTKPAIFIVDDDPAVRDSMQHLFESLGLAIEAHRPGEEFLERANSLHDAWSRLRRGCLLLDLRMPDAAGLKFLERLAASRERPPIIIITSHGDIPMAVRAIKAGAVDFIEKPLTDEAILDDGPHSLERDEQGRAKQLEIDQTAARIALLTPREREVLDHLIIGRKNKEIAFDLGISPRTVEIHRARVMTKMQAKNLSQLVLMAVAPGINVTRP